MYTSTDSKNFDIIKQSLYSTKITRMLAQENLGVRFDSFAKTACFEPKSRTITFPHSAEFLDHDVHELFMMHEISHALHIPENSFDILKKKKVNFDYFNIVLDIRDERLIKAKYPGCVASMIRGYEKLMDRGFFGNKEEMNFSRFANRLNIYAKCGVKSASFIDFTEKEIEFYNRCYAAETFDDLIDLAIELQVWEENARLNMPSDLIEAQEKELEDYVRRIVEGQGEDAQEFDGDDDYSEGGGMTQKEMKERIEKEKKRIREQMSQQIFEKSFQESILSNAHVINYTSISKKFVRVISAKKYAAYCREYMTKHWYNQENDENISTLTESVRTTRKAIQQSVDGMVRVFEARKEAQRYKNAKVSDTGQIDINKAYRYQFDDKIFRRSVRVPNQKNHAYYIMIDCSGSMSRRFSAVIEQVVVLTEFLRRIQVPYKVIGFGACVSRGMLSEKENQLDYSTAYENPYNVSKESMQTNGTLVRYVNERIFEVLSSDQTLQEHNLAITGLFKSTGFDLGSTPTGAAMLRAEHHAVEFFESIKADKRHMVVITDGQPTDLQTTSYGYSGKTLLLADPITKKVVTSKGSAQYSAINCIGKIFQYRYGITFSTISLVPSFNTSNTCSFISSGVSEKEASEFRKFGYAMMIDTWTQNKIFFAKPFGVETDADDFEVTENQTASQIARSMSKNLKSVKKSRIFLNALAESLS